MNKAKKIRGDVCPNTLKKNGSGEMQELSRLTSIAWVLYRSRDFKGAISAYRDVSKAFPEDALSLVMVERCLRFVANPPTVDWDGVYHAETK